MQGHAGHFAPSLVLALNPQMTLSMGQREYAFTVNQVPHVFGERYFVGHKHKYMEKFTERCFPNANLRKGTRDTPIKSIQPGENPMGKQSWSSSRPATRRRW
jgi:hypothetical protein